MSCCSLSKSFETVTSRNMYIMAASSANNLTGDLNTEVELRANWESCTVVVTQVGSNSSAIGDKDLTKDVETNLPPSATLHFLSHQYPHTVRFTGIEHKRSLSNSSKPSKKDSPMVNVDREKSRKRCASDKAEKSHKKLKMNNAQIERTNSEDEDLRNIAEKLKQLKKSVKTETTEYKPKHSDVEKFPLTEKSAQKVKTASLSLTESECSPAPESVWQQDEKLYIYTRKGVTSSSKIAAFDIDGTIITTQSGKVFATNPGDWRILYPEIPGKLKQVHADGYKVVFITNQMGVSKGKIKIDDLQTKFMNIVNKIGIPIQVFVATGSGIFRKPSPGIWRYLTKKKNDGVKVDMHSSYYVGDAAGRPAKWAARKKKDFSSSDRLFALNAGLKFLTPEEYFQDKKPAPYDMPEFDPRKLSEMDSLYSPESSSITSTKQEVIVMVGRPASGKSFFCREYLIPNGYTHINRDALGTWQKCVAQCSKSLKEGSSMVIDNTNPDVETRKRYSTVSKQANVQCRCFVFQASHAQARHNERFREMTDKSHKPINDMVMNSYKSKFSEPVLSEGFTEILKINFVPKFDNKEHEKLFKQFLLEK